MSKISPLPNIHWSPKASLIDLLEDAEDIDGMLILYWSKSDEILHSQSANINRRDALWMIEQEKKDIL